MKTPFNISAVSFTKLVHALVWIAIASLIVIVAVATWALFTAEHSGAAALHVRLVGNFLDGADDVADAFAGLAKTADRVRHAFHTRDDLFHRVQRLPNDPPAIIGFHLGLLCRRCDFLRTMRHIRSGDTHGFYCGGYGIGLVVRLDGSGAQIL